MSEAEPAGLIMKDLKVIFFATSEFVASVLEVLHRNYNLAVVVTRPDQKTITLAFLKLNPNGLVLTPDKISSKGVSKQFVNQIKGIQPDLIVVASFGRIIPQEVLDIPKYGCLNIHPSLLPKYRGVSPMPTAILNGDKETGVTVIKMDKEMDHGPIIATRSYRLSQEDNFQTLSIKLFQIGAGLLIEVIPDFIQGKVDLVQQDHWQATFTKFITKEDGYFNPNNPPSLKQLDRMIRAYYPWPTAWTKWDDKIVKLLPDETVQIAGKKPVKLAEFLRGYPDFPIKTL